VERYHHRNVAPLQPLAAQFRDAFLLPGDGPRRRAAQRANRLRPDRHQLPVQKLSANFHLVRLRSAVARRPALHHIADVNIVAGQRDAFFLRRPFNHLRQQLPGSPHKRKSLRVFVRARSFAHKHQRRVLAAHAEHNLIAPFVQPAPLAVANVVLDDRQRIARRRHLGKHFANLRLCRTNFLCRPARVKWPGRCRLSLRRRRTLLV